jgi:ABC-type antimicrobial peptide transport system permease subunit
VLGVIIGTATVIAVSSIIVGLGRDVSDYLEDYGTNTLFIYKFSPGIHIGRLSNEERVRKPLTLGDMEAIAETCPSVRRVVAEVFYRFGMQPRHVDNVRYKEHEIYDIGHTGTLPTYQDVFNARVAKGRFFTEAENLHRISAAVIGHDIAEAFFVNEEPLEKTILINGVPYQVVGVLEKRKGQFFRDESADKQILVPYFTYRKNNPGADDHFIGAEAYPGKMGEAEDEIRTVLRRRRNVPYNKPDNFGISSAEQIVAQFKDITGAIALAMVVISSIGLLVGGVGVMNIMLVSVTERTREIGVRKAIGARRRDIIWQFLTEAMTLTGAGGIIGILTGVGLSLLINAFMPKLPSVVPAWAIAAGVILAESVGLFFGMYPAVKAAGLDPVEALRYE